MKKQYTEPAINIVVLATESQLMSASGGDTTYSAGDGINSISGDIEATDDMIMESKSHDIDLFED